MRLLISVFGMLVYILAGRLLMRQLAGIWREALFAILNVAGLYGFFFYSKDHFYTRFFWVYLALVIFQFAMLQVFAGKNGWLPWLAFFTPILALIFVRYGTPLLCLKV